MLKDKLKEYRTACEMSQQAVADLLNIHRSTYSYYELGTTEPSLDNIRALCKIFGVSLDALLEIDLPRSLTVHGNSVYPDVPTRVGDLARDEQMLVMRYRMLTQSQRDELLSLMLSANDLPSENNNDE